MKKKITHSVLFVAVLAGTTALTLFAGRGNLSSTIYNFVFLAVIAVLYLIAMFGGMFRMNNLSTACLLYTSVCACHRKVRLFVHREAFTDYGVNSNCCCERKEQ